MTSMHSSSAMSMLFSPVAVGVGLLLAVVLLLTIGYLVGRIYVVRSEETLMTQNWEDFERAVPAGIHVLWKPWESVVRGPRAPTLEYPACDEHRKPRAGHLRHESTGKIDLRPQICVPPPFLAMSNDKHNFQVECSIEFSVDAGKLKHVYEHSRNFGLTLVKRIEQAFRTQFGELNDEVLLKQQARVRQRVLEALKSAESSADGQKPLGVNFHDVSFHFPEVEAPAMAAGSTGGGGSVAGLPDSPRTARPVGVAWLETQSYDRINNAFKELAPQDRASCLLAILDMQNKHNVADALGNSGQLIIVTSGELGLTGGGVQLDAIMKAVEHKHDGKPGPGGASSR